MQFSPTCWYEAVAEYPPDCTPHFHLEGGGDDWGVLISGDAIADHRIGIELFVPAGPDARAMVHALRKMPGWSTVSDFQHGAALPPQTPPAEIKNPRMKSAANF
jgi:hypothetical protein